MSTPDACLGALRLLLLALGCALGAWTAGLGAPPSDWAVGPQARAAAVYAVTLLAFASAPRMRRDDLAAATLALALIAEAFHAVLLRHVSPVLPAADLAGVGAAWAPAAIEHFRRLAREARYVAFSDLAGAERRRCAASGTPRAALTR